MFVLPKIGPLQPFLNEVIAKGCFLSTPNAVVQEVITQETSFPGSLLRWGEGRAWERG